MGGETSLESARISPTEQSTILQKQTSAAMVHQLRSTNHTTSIRHLQHSRSTEPMRWGPAHDGGLGPSSDVSRAITARTAIRSSQFP